MTEQELIRRQPRTPVGVDLLGLRVDDFKPQLINKMVVLLCKAGFSPDLESTRMWDASLKRQNNPPSASAAFEAFGCRCLVFLVLAPACTAVRFGLLLSTLSRLTHILYAVLDGSNFRVGVLSMRAPLSPRCTALSAASCGNHGGSPELWYASTRKPRGKREEITIDAID